MDQQDVVQGDVSTDLGRNDKLIPNPTLLNPVANKFFRSLILAKMTCQSRKRYAIPKTLANYWPSR